MLATLARERILRPAAADGGAPRYEIYHDVLGEAVLAWRAAHEAERELAAERKRAAGRHRRLLAALGAGGVLLAVMAGVTAYAAHAAGRGADAGAPAQARQLDSAAVSQLTVDPELSLVLAAEAARLVPGAQTEEALRTSYIFSRERSDVPTRGPVSAASYSPDGKLDRRRERGRDRPRLRRRDATARAHCRSRRRRRCREPRSRPTASGSSRPGRTARPASGTSPRGTLVSHAAARVSGAHGVSRSDGSAVVTSGGREVKIWRSDGELVASVPWRKPVTGAAFSPGGRLVLATGNDSVARIYDAATGRLVRRLDQGGRVTSAAFGPGGGLLVTTGANETARIWRVRDGGAVARAEGSSRIGARRGLQPAWRKGRDRERRRHRTDLGRAHR